MQTSTAEMGTEISKTVCQYYIFATYFKSAINPDNNAIIFLIPHHIKNSNEKSTYWGRQKYASW